MKIIARVFIEIKLQKKLFCIRKLLIVPRESMSVCVYVSARDSVYVEHEGGQQLDCDFFFLNYIINHIILYRYISRELSELKHNNFQ